METVVEIWKSVKDHEGIYEVSNLGRIKSLSRPRLSPYGAIWFSKERILSFFKTNCGYLIVGLHGTPESKTRTVHRIVAEAFIGEPNDGMQVNHKNGIKTDNRAENLEYISASSNRKHAFEIGLACAAKGEQSLSAKLTDCQVKEIREIYKRGGIAQHEIARDYCVSQMLVSLIVRNKHRSV